METAAILPCLTADIPGTGGTIKDSPEDFMVTEIPAYEPSGAGEHLFLTIEKRGLTTLEAIRRIAAALKLPEREIGYAGMKDAVGITRQMISVPRVTAEAALSLSLEGITVLSAVRHGNKLKLGHLKGNRFRIVVRGVRAESGEAAQTILDILKTRGVPNYFGYQRYGAQGNSHLIGAAMLRGEWRRVVDCLIGSADAVHDDQWKKAIATYHMGDLSEALRLMPRYCRSERDLLQRLIAKPDAWEKAFSVIHPRLKKLYLSAFQSSLFDLVVAQRLSCIDQVMEGDLAWKHLNGACFLVEDPAAEAPRAEAFEISASGPMFGSRMTEPSGAVRELEQGILAASGISVESFDCRGGLRLEGGRRPVRVPLGEPSCALDGDQLLLEFTLPKGSYATTVVREITKTH